MKYFIKEYDIIINLDYWRKIRKCDDHIEGTKVFCIEIFYNLTGTNGLSIEDMYYWNSKEERDKVFNEINDAIL